MLLGGNVLDESKNAKDFHVFILPCLMPRKPERWTRGSAWRRVQVTLQRVAHLCALDWLLWQSLGGPDSVANRELSPMLLDQRMPRRGHGDSTSDRLRHVFPRSIFPSPDDCASIAWPFCTTPRAPLRTRRLSTADTRLCRCRCRSPALSPALQRTPSIEPISSDLAVVTGPKPRRRRRR